uniref:Biotin carboxyl carrier protein of acetyl-CoA carboxylase n=1 Tax=Candidatus Aschnera chinzeii TaxID=1485666 RepID=A0AAT9G447_9ENTR|nr:MAG: acetyl-CoA carboxylase biotin carboxyl carrier protein [Candidatus Aschnera chinzeii]
MNTRKIKKLIEIFEKSTISELEISNGDESIRINRYMPHNIETRENNSINSLSYKIETNNTSTQATSTLLNKKNEEQNNNKNNHTIFSPMVGTFYRSPNPKTKPFVEIGQKVKPGDPLCIVEAMKMMNQIEADTSGIIKSILLKNGDSVEFNEPLMIIEQ